MSGADWARAPREKPIVALVGPTATGKTRAAIELAERTNGELVGADSVQVYRGFDIGSAKPTKAELGGTAHHLIDVADPNEAIDAARFAVLADRAIDEVLRRGHVPIVVGGTGLWIRALLRGLLAAPPVDAELRAKLDEQARVQGAHALHARLAAVDPRAAEDIHPNDRLRVVRALEYFEQTGKAMGAMRAEHALGAPRYRALVIALDLPRDEHTRVVTERVHDMLARGFVDEVRELLERWGPDVRAFGSVGYRQARDHVQSGVSLEETRTAIVRATRIYARRQRTWFRSEPGVDGWATANELVGEPWKSRIGQHLDR